MPACRSALRSSSTMLSTVRSSSVKSLQPYPKGSATTTLFCLDSSLIKGSKSSTGAAVPSPGNITMVLPFVPLVYTCIFLPFTSTYRPHAGYCLCSYRVISQLNDITSSRIAPADSMMFRMSLFHLNLFFVFIASLAPYPDSFLYCKRVRLKSGALKV
ncbi:hypothetical protein D3C80_1637620 [compost metagenome]